LTGASGPALEGELDAVFLDRDGTINVKAPEGAYILSPRQVHLLPGAGGAVRRLNDAGVLVLVVSNQRGVALGHMTIADVGSVNAELARRLRRYRAKVNAFYVCPHEAGTCDCRKPAPGLLLQAFRDHPKLRPDRCVMVGDAESDVRAGMAAGCRALRLGAPGTTSEAEAVYASLATAVAALLPEE
jgi:D-glycero-D-manno-heptose 1,7-bisphosphate phosphatase